MGKKKIVKNYITNGGPYTLSYNFNSYVDISGTNTNVNYVVLSDITTTETAPQELVLYYIPENMKLTKAYIILKHSSADSITTKLLFNTNTYEIESNESTTTKQIIKIPIIGIDNLTTTPTLLSVQIKASSNSTTASSINIYSLTLEFEPL